MKPMLRIQAVCSRPTTPLTGRGTCASDPRSSCPSWRAYRSIKRATSEPGSTLPGGVHRAPHHTSHADHMRWNRHGGAGLVAAQHPFPNKLVSSGIASARHVDPRPLARSAKGDNKQLVDRAEAPGFGYDRLRRPA